MTVDADRVPPISKYSTQFELSNFKNSLKSLASAGIAIEGPSQKFERPQPLIDWTRQPVLNGVVRIRQAGDGKLRAVQPEVLGFILECAAHDSSLPRNESAPPRAEAHSLEISSRPLPGEGFAGRKPIEILLNKNEKPERPN